MTTINPPGSPTTRDETLVVSRDVSRDRALDAHGVAATAPMSWSAIIAGGVLAAAITAALMTLAAGVGLSLTTVTGGDGADAETAGWTAVAVLIGIHLIAFGSGGYMAARLRVVALEKSLTDVRARDSAHGMMAWAVGVLISATVLTSFVTGAIDRGAQLAGSALGAAGQTASTVASAGASVAGPNLDYFADTLLRPGDGAGAPATGAFGATGTGAAPAAGDGDAALGEISRIVTRYVQTGDLPQADRDRVAAIVSQRTGVTPEEANARIDQAIAQIDEAAERAGAAAETARRAAASAALWTFAAALAGLLAAMTAAVMGGARRDEPSA